MNSLNVITILSAALISIISMLSLLIGAAIGIYIKPSERINAIIMAFGTGAMIQALVLELAYQGAMRLVTVVHFSPLLSWSWIAVGFTLGGFMYYIVNVMLEKRGAAIRHPALSKLYLLKKKREESASILSRLSNIQLVRSLPPEEMEDVLVCVQPVHFKTGEIVFRRGEKGNALFFIDEGTIQIIPEDDASQTATPLAQLHSGQSFGEMALLTGEPRTATAMSLTDTSLLTIKKEHFDELIDRSPKLHAAVSQLISERLLHNVEKTKGTVAAHHWQKIALSNIQRLRRSEVEILRERHVSAGAPLAIFLGAMLDGIPESLVIGSNFISFHTLQFSFIAAVFLANLPEAIASAKGMKDAGYSNLKVFGLWSSLIIAGAVTAALGNIYFSTATPTIVTFVGAIAGGGILAMVSSVMMPEAYEDGGASVGLATIAGFLTALLFYFI